MSKPIIVVSHLTSGFDDTVILDDVSMDAKEHEITVILGTSGCGKTTLLKNFIRLYQPWAGSIHLYDRLINDMDEPEFDSLESDFRQD